MSIYFISRDHDNTQALHNMCFALITTPKEEIMKGRAHCLWQIFLASLFMKIEKGFSKPDEITPYLATCKYLFKTIIFMECENQVGFIGNFDE